MLYSKRLRLRKLCETDFDLYYELYSHKEVMKYALLDPFTSIDEAKHSFYKVLAMQLNDQAAQFIATIKDTDRDIGIVDYELITRNHDSSIFEIGYFIKPDFWGYGYGTEMAQVLINFIFGSLSVHKIVASCNSNNKNSEKIMKKLGMVREGIFRKARYKNGYWDDEIKYALLREEWISRVSR